MNKGIVMRKPPQCQPVCFHPTMGTFIDDSKSYLSLLSNALKLADIHHKMIINPKTSNEFIRRKCQKSLLA